MVGAATMSDRFKWLVAGMRRDAVSARYRRQYAEAQQRNDCLSRYQATVDVLQVLSSERVAQAAERDSLTRALVEEHRRRKSALWSTMLVAAYYPMLSCLRHRIVTDYYTRDELDQLVLCAFLETLDTVSLEGSAVRVALRLRRDTARALFWTMDHERSKESLSNDFEELASSVGSSSSIEQERATQLVFGDLYRCVGGELTDEVLGTILATVLGGEATRSYARHIGSGDPGEVERFYERLKRQRSRALLLLRNTLCPNDALFERSA
jgi:hypothetical protein